MFNPSEVDPMSQPDRDGEELDPLYLSSLKELRWILGVWAVSFLWVIGISRWLGYRAENADQIQLVLGMPLWVFWGVFVPWIAVTLWVTWFAMCKMEDHPLEDANEVEGRARDDSSSEEVTDE